MSASKPSRRVVDALKSLALAGGTLLAVYIPSGMLLGVYIRSQGRSSAAMVGFAAFIVVVLFCARRLLGLRMFGARRDVLVWSAAFGALALFALLSLTIVYGNVVGMTIRSLVPIGLGWTTAVVYGTSVALMAAVSEEIAFRGIVQSWLCRWVSFAWGLALTSALFALWHFGNPLIYKLFPYYFLVGATLGAVYRLTGGLALPILLHFACRLNRSTQHKPAVFLQGCESPASVVDAD